MEMIINDVKIHYEKYGQGSDTIILLPGWGQNTLMMKPVGDKLCKEFNIVLIDLPGFGNSSEPTYPWSVIDYVEMLHEFISNLKIENPIIIGHSYGGKTGLMYASKYNVKKLILFGSPFKKEVEKVSLKVKFLKTCKKIPILNKLEGFAKKRIGSTDYKNASEMMRQVLVNTVNLDISEDIKKIKASTLLIWGSLDEAVPLKRAYELESLLKDAGVVVYENCTHYAYLERLGQTISIIRSFLGGK